jgi:hypothetical protein
MAGRRARRGYDDTPHVPDAWALGAAPSSRGRAMGSCQTDAGGHGGTAPAWPVRTREPAGRGWGRARRGHGARSRVGRGRAQPPKPPCPHAVEMTSSHARATRRCAWYDGCPRWPAGWILAVTRTPPAPAKRRRMHLGVTGLPQAQCTSKLGPTQKRDIHCYLHWLRLAVLCAYAVPAFVHFYRLQDSRARTYKDVLCGISNSNKSISIFWAFAVVFGYHARLDP